MSRIAVLDDYQGIALELADWNALGDADITVFREPFADVGAAADALRPFDIVCLMRERTPFGADLIARLPALRLLVTTGMRNAAVDVAAAAAAGITVCGTRGGAHATAELAWGLILCLMRNIPVEDRSIRDDGWQTRIGLDLNGKTLGLIGLGRLGSRVARVGLAFDMDVIGWSQNLSAERAAEVGARRVDKAELLARADVISIHLVLSERTRGLIGAGELAAMKRGAFLVNTSRGPIVEQTALIEALRDGTIAGAGLDVYDQEPLPPGHPLRQVPNTVLSPHIGYVTRETYRQFYGDTVAAIAAWRAGDPVRVIAAPDD